MPFFPPRVVRLPRSNTSGKNNQLVKGKKKEDQVDATKIVDSKIKTFGEKLEIEMNKNNPSLEDQVNISEYIVEEVKTEMEKKEDWAAEIERQQFDIEEYDVKVQPDILVDQHSTGTSGHVFGAIALSNQKSDGIKPFFYLKIKESEKKKKVKVTNLLTVHGTDKSIKKILRPGAFLVNGYQYAVFSVFMKDDLQTIDDILYYDFITELSRRGIITLKWQDGEAMLDTIEVVKGKEKIGMNEYLMILLDIIKNRYYIVADRTIPVEMNCFNEAKVKKIYIGHHPEEKETRFGYDYSYLNIDYLGAGIKFQIEGQIIADNVYKYPITSQVYSPITNKIAVMSINKPKVIGTGKMVKIEDHSGKIIFKVKDIKGKLPSNVEKNMENIVLPHSIQRRFDDEHEIKIIEHAKKDASPDYYIVVEQEIQFSGFVSERAAIQVYNVPPYVYDQILKTQYPVSLLGKIDNQTIGFGYVRDLDKSLVVYGLDAKNDMQYSNFNTDCEITYFLKFVSEMIHGPEGRITDLSLEFITEMLFFLDEELYSRIVDEDLLSYKNILFKYIIANRKQWTYIPDNDQFKIKVIRSKFGRTSRSCGHENIIKTECEGCLQFWCGVDTGENESMDKACDKVSSSSDDHEYIKMIIEYERAQDGNHECMACGGRYPLITEAWLCRILDGLDEPKVYDDNSSRSVYSVNKTEVFEKLFKTIPKTLLDKRCKKLKAVEIDEGLFVIDEMRNTPVEVEWLSLVNAVVINKRIEAEESMSKKVEENDEEIDQSSAFVETIKKKTRAGKKIKKNSQKDDTDKNHYVNEESARDTYEETVKIENVEWKEPVISEVEIKSHDVISVEYPKIQEVEYQEAKVQEVIVDTREVIIENPTDYKVTTEIIKWKKPEVRDVEIKYEYSEYHENKDEGQKTENNKKTDQINNDNKDDDNKFEQVSKKKKGNKVKDEKIFEEVYELESGTTIQVKRNYDSEKNKYDLSINRYDPVVNQSFVLYYSPLTHQAGTKEITNEMIDDYLEGIDDAVSKLYEDIRITSISMKLEKMRVIAAKVEGLMIMIKSQPKQKIEYMIKKVNEQIYTLC